MSAQSSSAANCDSEDVPADEPLLSSNSDKASPVEITEVKSEESYSQQHSSSPKISIGHVYVYNFSSAQPVETVIDFPSPTETALKLKQAVVSPAASSGPYCRICHEGDAKEDLLSPCFCRGTVGLVHLSCVEKWLGTSGSDKCEICHYPFATIRRPKPFSEWVQSAAYRSGQRNLWGDASCFLMLTPLAAVSSFLSIDGALKQMRWQNSIESGCLMALATFLITIYILWSTLTFRFHLKSYLKWREQNHNVKILMLRRRLSSTDDRFLNSRRTRHTHPSIGAPGNVQQSHTTVNIPTSPSRNANAFNNEDVAVNATSSDENHRTDFIQHLTYMFETAL